MAVTQYIGSRVVPLFADPAEWSSENTYEPLTIVLHEGNSYTSKQAVPKGIDISDRAYWEVTGNYNAQVEQYRRETARALEVAQDAQGDIDVLLPKADFSAENTVKKYVDDVTNVVNELTTAFNATLPAMYFTPQNTIKEYIDSFVKNFNCVQDMIIDDSIGIGMICHTNGFYNDSNNGSAFYKIESSGSGNNFDSIQLENDLYANLIESDYIDVACYGADTSGNIYSSSSIQYVIDKYPGKSIYFPDGNYKLDKTILSWAGFEKHTDFMFSPNANFFTDINLRSLFFVGGYNPNDRFNTISFLGQKYYFIGGRFNGDNCEVNVILSGSSTDTQFTNCHFYNCKNGLLVGEGERIDGSIDLYVDNCNFRGTGKSDSYGIRFLFPDYKVSHCRIYGFQTCLDCLHGGAYFYDIHTLDLSQSRTEYNLSDSCCINCPNGGRNSFLAVYSNGNGTFLRLNYESANFVRIIDCEYRNWTLENSDMVFIDFLNTQSTPTTSWSTKVTIIGCFLYFDNPGDTGHIRYGIKGITPALQSNIYVEDNILWGQQNLTNDVDLILFNKPVPLNPASNKTGNSQYWYYIGSMPELPGVRHYKLNITAGVNDFYCYFTWNGNQHSRVAFSAISGNGLNSGTYTIGYVYENGEFKFYLGKESGTFNYGVIICKVENEYMNFYLAYKYSNLISSSGSQQALGGAFDAINMTSQISITI